MKKILLGHVTTLEDSLETAEAVVIKDGIIEYVGSKDEALKYKDDNTEILDHKDNYIYPGFIESHCHGFFAGYRNKGQIDLSMEFGGYDNYGTIIKDYIKRNPNKNLYLAFGWNEVFGQIDRTFLDDIYSDGALVLNTAGGHSCLLNSKAMEMMGVDENLVKKYGTTLVHVDKDGNPTGYICEEAAVVLLGNLPVEHEDAKEYILDWQNTALSKGITACADAGAELIYKRANEAYHELEIENKLKLRTFSFSLVKDNESDAKEAIDKIMDIKKNYDGEYFKTIGAKTFLDGVGEARTSWTINEYNDEKGYYGVKRFSDTEKMVNLINEASKKGLSVHVHSEGDGATRFILDCIMKSQATTNDLDQRNIIAHLHFVDKADFKNMARTNSIPLVPPLWSPAFPGVVERETQVFGKEMADNTYPIKSFLDEGCKICFHTDYPISPIIEIARSVYTAVNRKVPKNDEIERGLTDSSHNTKESIDRLNALKAMTINCAYAFKQEDRMGSIKIGKIANFAVLDKDLLNDPDDEMIQAKTVATIVDGEVVFKA